MTGLTPVAVKVALNVAVADAETPEERLAGEPVTGAEPKIVPPELKVIVPVGPTPELPVLTVEDKATRKFAEALGRGFMVTAEAAWVMEIRSAAEVLEVKLLSPA